MIQLQYVNCNIYYECKYAFVQNNRTALHLACYQGCFEIVKELLKRDDMNVNIIDRV